MLLPKNNTELRNFYRIQTKEKLLAINLDTPTISYSQEKEDSID